MDIKNADEFIETLEDMLLSYNKNTGNMIDNIQLEYDKIQTLTMENISNIKISLTVEN